MLPAEPWLSVQDLSVHFGPITAPVRAVNQVSFEVARGEAVGLVLSLIHI